MDIEDFCRDLEIFYYEILRNLIHGIKKGKTLLPSASRAREFYGVHCTTRRLRYCFLDRYAVCYTSAVMCYFSHLLTILRPIVVQNAIFRRQLRICCLGNKPPLEVVAISRIMRSYQYTCCFRDRRPLELLVTVVAGRKDWASTGKLILQSLKRNTSLFDTAGTVIQFGFIQNDLALPLTRQVHETISSADILTIVGTTGDTKPAKKAHLLQTVMRLLKPKSIIFLLDTGNVKYYKIINKVASSFDDMKLIYGPYKNEIYSVSCSNDEMHCLTSCQVTVAAWMKIASTELTSRPVSARNPDDTSESKLKGKRKEKLPWWIQNEDESECEVENSHYNGVSQMFFKTKSKQRRILVTERNTNNWRIDLYDFTLT